jgi:hypothetical protein
MSQGTQPSSTRWPVVQRNLFVVIVQHKNTKVTVIRCQADNSEQTGHEGACLTFQTCGMHCVGDSPGPDQLPRDLVLERGELVVHVAVHLEASNENVRSYISSRRQK